MRVLSAEGLLETVPYRGTTVKALTKTDIEELYSLRGALESFAIQRIIASQRIEVVWARRTLDGIHDAAGAI